jgi:hypothetical protein
VRPRGPLIPTSPARPPRRRRPPQVLCRHGGIYADSDTVCVAPLPAWLERGRAAAAAADAAAAAARARAHAAGEGGAAPRRKRARKRAAPGLVVGIENVFHSQEEAEELTYVRKVQMIQWTLGAAPGHPVPCGMGGLIKARLANESAAAAAAAARGGAFAGGEAYGAVGGGGGGGGGGDEAGAGTPAAPPLGHDAEILLRTGPGIWSDALHRWGRVSG